MVNENLIATLEQSLRQTRQSRSQKMSRLREIEAEAENLRQEIEALDNSAAQMEAAIRSLLFALRSSRSTARKYGDHRDMQELDALPDLSDLAPPKSSKSQQQQNSYQSRPILQMRHSGGSKHYIPPIDSDVEVKTHRFSDRTITQACSMLLREANRPLHVNELYNRLLEGGFEFTGNNPTISIAVSLNRNRRFRKVAPGTFDLVIRDASQAAS